MFRRAETFHIERNTSVLHPPIQDVLRPTGYLRFTVVYKCETTFSVIQNSESTINTTFSVRNQKSESSIVLETLLSAREVDVTVSREV